jgi:hypothetical protein
MPAQSPTGFADPQGMKRSLCASVTSWISDRVPLAGNAGGTPAAAGKNWDGVLEYDPGPFETRPPGAPQDEDKHLMGMRKIPHPEEAAPAAVSKDARPRSSQFGFLAEPRGPTGRSLAAPSADGPCPVLFLPGRLSRGQAAIRTRTGRTAQTHRGVHRLLSQKEPELADLALFLSQAYNLKAVADYELGQARAYRSIARAPRSIGLKPSASFTCDGVWAI